MDIRVLKYFITVVEEENILKASQVLHITQPTLSRQLMDLEKELNCKLFIRSNRKITLTSEGLFLYNKAKEIILLQAKTINVLKNSHEIISGDIYIGCAETNAFKFLVKTMTKIKKTHKDIHYHIFSGNADTVIEQLDKGILDFGLLIDAHDKQKYNFITLPVKDIWGLLMLKNSPLADKEYITSSDILNIPLICSGQTMVSNKIAGWLNQNFTQLNIVANYNLIYNASIMVQENLGSALCLANLVNTNGTNLCFKPLYPPLEAQIDLVWKKHQILTKPAQLFLQNLQEYLLQNK